MARSSTMAASGLDYGEMVYGAGDAMVLTLFVLKRFTELPDLLDFFEYDAEKFLEFVNRFGGMRLLVPDREEVGRMARNMHIYRTLLKDRSVLTLDRLARLYGITVDRVVRIYDETFQEVKRLDEASGEDTYGLLGAGESG